MDLVGPVGEFGHGVTTVNNPDVGTGAVPGQVVEHVVEGVNHEGQYLASERRCREVAVSEGAAEPLVAFGPQRVTVVLVAPRVRERVVIAMGDDG